MLPEDDLRRAPEVSLTGRARWLKRATDHPILTVAIVAFVARLACAVVISKVFGGVLFNDDSTYSGMARAVVEGYASTSWDDYTRGLYNGTATFSLPLTALYWVLGPNQLAGQLLASAFGVASAACVTALALRIVPRQIALGAGLVIALLPSQVLFSSLTLKDAAVWAALAGLGLAVAQANDRRGWALVGPTVAIALLLVAVAHLRLHTFVMVAWALAIAAWAGEPAWRTRRAAVALALAFLLPWALGVGPGGYDIVRSAGNLEDIRLANAVGAVTALVNRPPLPPSAEQVRAAESQIEETETRLRAAQAELERMRRRGDETSAGTAAVDELLRLRALRQAKLDDLNDEARRAASPAASSDDTWVRANIGYLPKGLGIVVLGPFVWDIDGNSKVVLAATELLVWYPLLVLAAYGLVELRRRRSALVFPVLVGAGVALMYGLAEGNFGTAYRHRGELVWVVALFAALGTARLVDRWQRRST